MNCSSHVRHPEVSVLMSCYNANRWLHEAIDSVMAQTFENFEFILVNDGSTDETWDIIQSYRRQDPRIIAISKENTGLADSLNVGIAQARGTWIARIDADDLCEPTRLEEQVNFVRHRADIVLLGSGFFEIDEHGQIIKTHLYPSKHRELVSHLERLQRFFPHSSAFYQTNVVKQIGGYNLRILRAEDWRLWLELSLHGRLACLPKPLVRNRKHSNQISLDDSGRRQICDGVVATVCHMLKKEGFKDPSVSASEDEWILFLSWIEKRIKESGFFDRRKAWVAARSDFLAGESMVSGTLHFGVRLIQSGYACELILEKFFGVSLPLRLARKWIKQSCAASSV